jgi:hypothetical protein
MFDGISSEAFTGDKVQVELGGRLAQLMAAVPTEPLNGVSSSE